MWHLDSIRYFLHGQLKSLLGKKQRQYSPIGVWLTMALVALTHKEFECPKYLIHEPPLVYEGSIGWRSSSNRSRSCLPFASDTWKVIFQIFKISLHSLFLSKSQDDLHGNKGVKLNIFVSLSTMEWRGQLLLLGQSQNSMEFEGCLLKNSLRSFDMAINWCW